MGKDLLDYPSLVRRALLGVVRDVLDRTAREGLPGEHHFFLAFRTDHPGVEMPDWLRSEQGDEMTIVLQHQFWDLSVAEEGFSVALKFAGRPAKVSVPFEALVAFTDPAVPLGLRLADSPVGEGDAPGASRNPHPTPEAPQRDESSRVVPFHRPPRGE
jgi:uncharacterized protein